MPIALLTELIVMGATLRPVPDAAELCTEPRYRPSAKLARFVRSRDLTCCCRAVTARPNVATSTTAPRMVSVG